MNVTLRLFGLCFAGVAITLIYLAIDSQEWVIRDGFLISGALFASALLMLKSSQGFSARRDD